MNEIYYYLISGGIIGLGIILFFYLSNHTIYRTAKISKTVEHYTKIRDKIVKKKAGIKDESLFDNISLSSIGGLIGLGLVILVGYNVLNAVKESLENVTNSTTIISPTINNVSNIMLSPLFFIFFIVPPIIFIFIKNFFYIDDF